MPLVLRRAGQWWNQSQSWLFYTQMIHLMTAFKLKKIKTFEYLINNINNAPPHSRRDCSICSCWWGQQPLFGVYGAVFKNYISLYHTLLQKRSRLVPTDSKTRSRDIPEGSCVLPGFLWMCACHACLHCVTCDITIVLPQSSQFLIVTDIEIRRKAQPCPCMRLPSSTVCRSF